jgi:hypothetical protein
MARKIVPIGGLISGIYAYIWVNYNDLTVLPHWKSWFILGKSSPRKAQQFRLVKYYNLPRYITIIPVSVKLGLRLMVNCGQSNFLY